MNTQAILLTLSMLASAPSMHARFLNHSRIIEITAKLKALERNPEKIAIFEKNFNNNALNRFILMPGTYNQITALMLELLDTADQKPTTQVAAMTQVLEMIDSELMGLINRLGYRKEIIALSYKTDQLRTTLRQGVPMNPVFAAMLKREIQDLIAEAMWSEKSSEVISVCVKKHMRKKENNEKESHTEPDSYGTDSK